MLYRTHPNSMNRKNLATDFHRLSLDKKRRGHNAEVKAQGE